MDAIMTSC